MSSDDIPDDIRAFLLGSIDSVGQLEALVLLATERQKRWTYPDVARRLYVNEPQAKGILEKLVTLGLAKEASEEFFFSPLSSTLEDLTLRLISVYRQKLVPVTHLIHSKPDRLREFSDAFKLKRET